MRLINQDVQSGGIEIARHSLYQLDRLAGSLSATGWRGEGFAPERYSLLKYGSAAAAVSWGEELANYVLVHLPEVMHEVGPVVTASAFHRVPTAAFAVARAMQTRVNGHRLVQALGPLEHARIAREAVYAGEYETLDTRSRQSVLADMRLQYQGPALAGRHVVVVDDVRVSGMHELVLAELLQREGPAAIHFVYLVEVHHALGASEPTIEQELNNAAVGSLEALRTLLLSEPTLLNARVVKRILLWPRSPQQLDALLGELPDSLLSRLYKAALADGYHRMPPFQGAFVRLEALMQERLQEDFERTRPMGDDPAAQATRPIDLARARAALN